ncbi:MAG: hypothetical protein JW990_03810 [Thermoleophilia bacterium]|nr:hypothetical protein [Thermoleophilia bacterium]
MTFYKFLQPDGRAREGRFWLLPTRKDRPGAWMPAASGELERCANGYHIFDKSGALYWLGHGALLVEVKTRGEVMEVGHKYIAREVHVRRVLPGWNERTARLFAADCAARVLRVFESKHPNDPGPRAAILTARRHASGQATDEELAAASRFATKYKWGWDGAPHEAAWAAAWATAGQWHHAADNAAQRARLARDGEGDAAHNAEQDWQTCLFWQYVHGPEPTPVRLPKRPEGRAAFNQIWREEEESNADKD